jgi:hypothetical protein
MILIYYQKLVWKMFQQMQIVQGQFVRLFQMDDILEFYHAEPMVFTINKC